MPQTIRDRQREVREARLRRIQQQISTGALVIRQMTASEHAIHVIEREKRHAAMTAAQRARCEAILRQRRRRAALCSLASEALTETTR